MEINNIKKSSDEEIPSDELFTGNSNLRISLLSDNSKYNSKKNLLELYKDKFSSNEKSPNRRSNRVRSRSNDFDNVSESNSYSPVSIKDKKILSKTILKINKKTPKNSDNNHYINNYDNNLLVKKIDLNEEINNYRLNVNINQISENESEENLDFDSFVNKYRHQTKIVDKVYKEQIEINKAKFFKVINEVANKNMIKMV
jgi:hypothetical protein